MKTDLSPSVEFGRLSRSRIPEGAALAARAMSPDPMSLVVFGEDETKRVARLDTIFRLTLQSLKLEPLTASLDGELVGLVAYARPGECFFKQMEARRKTIRVLGRQMAFSVPQIPIRMLLPLLRIGATAGKRLQDWTEVTGAHDPPSAHQHIELVVVAPGFQGKGIGRQIMEHVLDEMRDFEGMPYLETNTDSDVGFYERFGFSVLDSREAVGVQIRFMGIANWTRKTDDQGG